MKDLQPYICIYDICSIGDVLYDSEAAWLKHEQWEHAHQWCCDSADHPLVMFPRVDEFKTHMRKAHSETFQEHQLQGLADASIRPSLAAFESCPLCGVTPDIFGMPQVSGEAFISDTHAPEVPATMRTKDDRFVISKALEDLQKHVSRHLWQSAIIALPGRDDLDEAKHISNAGSEKAKSDTFDIFDISIDWMVPCPFVEDFKEPTDLALSGDELMWEEVFEAMGVRYGEDLGLEKVLTFAWPHKVMFEQTIINNDQLDSLNAATSISAVSQISAQVFNLCINYSLESTEARKDIQRLQDEMASLRDVLTSVTGLTEDPSSAKRSILSVLNQHDGPVQQCQKDLTELVAKLEPDQGKNKIKEFGWRGVEWPFTGEDMDKLCIVVEKHKTAFSLALTVDPV